MKKWFRSVSFKVLVILLCASALGCVAASLSRGASSPVTNALGVVFAPLERAAAYVSDGIAHANGRFVSSGYYMGEIDRLQSQIEDLRSQLVDYEQSRQKLALYEEFLGLKERHPDYTFAPGTVIARDSTDLYDSFVLDCGSVDGVSVNDPVIYGAYLAGVVKEVRTSSCVVKTCLNPGVSISAYEVRSREEGYVEGTAQLALDGSCRMSALSRNTAVSRGGIVCTSGIGGIYPRDLIIGTVTLVADETADISSYAVIEPSVDFHDLTDVFVLTDFSGQGESSSD